MEPVHVHSHSHCPQTRPSASIDRTDFSISARSVSSSHGLMSSTMVLLAMICSSAKITSRHVTINAVRTAYFSISSRRNPPGVSSLLRFVPHHRNRTGRCRHRRRQQLVSAPLMAATKERRHDRCAAGDQRKKRNPHATRSGSGAGRGKLVFDACVSDRARRLFADFELFDASFQIIQHLKDILMCFLHFLQTLLSREICRGRWAGRGRGVMQNLSNIANLFA